MKKLLLILFITALCYRGIGQQNPFNWQYPFQVNNFAPGQRVKGLRTTQILIPPALNALPNLPEVWQGDSTRGAMCYLTTDQNFYYFTGSQWLPFSSTADTTIFAPVLDSTGIPYQRVVVAGPDGKLRGYTEFIYDSANARLRIQRPFFASINDPGLIVDAGIHTNTLKSFRRTDLYNDIFFPDVAMLPLYHSTDTTGKAMLIIDKATGEIGRYEQFSNGSFEPVITAPHLPGYYWNGFKNFAVLNTDAVAEATNKYFTDARARAAISLNFTTTGTSSAATGSYNNSTGQFDINVPVILMGTTTQMNAIASPGPGLLFWNTTEATLYEYRGAVLGWSNFANGRAWQLTGNSGTLPANNFIGTTDLVSLRFRTNNVLRMTLDSNITRVNLNEAGTGAIRLNNSSGTGILELGANINAGYIAATQNNMFIYSTACCSNSGVFFQSNVTGTIIGSQVAFHAHSNTTDSGSLVLRNLNASTIREYAFNSFGGTQMFASVKERSPVTTWNNLLTHNQTIASHVIGTIYSHINNVHLGMGGGLVVKKPSFILQNAAKVRNTAIIIADTASTEGRANNYSIWSLGGLNRLDGTLKVGGASMSAQAAADIESNSKGILIPRMTTAERTAIAATNEQQEVNILSLSAGSAGIFRITYGGNNSVTIGNTGSGATLIGINSANIKTAIEGISGFAGTVTVTNAGIWGFTAVFGGGLAGTDVPALSITSCSCTSSSMDEVVKGGWSNGLTVFDTDKNLYYWYSSGWRWIGNRPYTPSSSSDTEGNTGDAAFDNDYYYIKTAAGWKRIALSTF